MPMCECYNLPPCKQCMSLFKSVPLRFLIRDTVSKFAQESSSEVYLQRLALFGPLLPHHLRNLNSRRCC